MDYLKELSYVKLLVKFMIPAKLEDDLFVPECVWNGISEDDLVPNRYVDTEWITRDGQYKIEVFANDYGGFVFCATDRKTGKRISGDDPLWKIYHPICYLNNHFTLWNDEEERMMDPSELPKELKYSPACDYRCLVPTRNNDFNYSL